MPRTELVLRVFVASPRDVEEERVALEAIVDEINKTLTPHVGIRLDLIKWETDVMPGVGESAQAVINRQIGDEYDIFIGILWKHFGTPTLHAMSGTEEEFNRAYDRFKAGDSELAIMLYFKDAPVPISEINPEQVARVQAFRTRLGPEGVLYRVYKDTDDFEKLVRIHLSKQLQSWKEKSAERGASVSSSANPVVDETDVVPVAAESDADEPGWLDLIELSSEQGAVLGDVLRRMSVATEELSTQLEARTGEMQAFAARGKPDVNKARQIINRTAIDIDRFTSVVNEDTPLFSETISKLVYTVSGLLALQPQFSPDDENELDEAVGEIRELADAIGRGWTNALEFRSILAAWPSIAGNLNKSRRRALAAMDGLIGEMVSAENAMRDAVAGF
jgi:hypothetical protein